MTNIELTKAFYEDYQSLCKKYEIVDTVCYNFDDDTFGGMQIFRVSRLDHGKVIIFGYSGSGESLKAFCTEEAVEKDE